MPPVPSDLGTMDVKPFSVASLALPIAGESFPVIEVIPGQIVTGRDDVVPATRDGAIVSDPSRDLLKLVNVERHKGTGNIGRALIKGFGLREGALGSSFAHDSHNIVVVGVSDEDIYACAQEIIRNEGGLAVVRGGQVIGSLPLPIGGLLSPQPLETVADELTALEAQAAALGCTLDSPFSTLSFMALPVIPHLKLSDFGLVDVMAARLIEV
jgi:adenine deaminase